MKVDTPQSVADVGAAATLLKFSLRQGESTREHIALAGDWATTYPPRKAAEVIRGLDRLLALSDDAALQSRLSEGGVSNVPQTPRPLLTEIRSAFAANVRKNHPQ